MGRTKSNSMIFGQSFIIIYLRTTWQTTNMPWSGTLVKMPSSERNWKLGSLDRIFWPYIALFTGRLHRERSTVWKRLHGSRNRMTIRGYCEKRETKWELKRNQLKHPEMTRERSKWRHVWLLCRLEIDCVFIGALRSRTMNGSPRRGWAGERFGYKQWHSLEFVIKVTVHHNII